MMGRMKSLIVLLLLLLLICIFIKFFFFVSAIFCDSLDTIVASHQADHAWKHFNTSTFTCRLFIFFPVPPNNLTRMRSLCIPFGNRNKWHVDKEYACCASIWNKVIIVSSMQRHQQTTIHGTTQIHALSKTRISFQLCVVNDENQGDWRGR